MLAPMHTVNGHYLAMIDDQYPPKILSVAKIPENVYNEQVKQAVEELNRMITSYLVLCAPVSVMEANMPDQLSLQGDKHDPTLFYDIYTPPLGYTIINSYGTPEGAGAEEVYRTVQTERLSHHPGMKRSYKNSTWEYCGHFVDEKTKTISIEWLLHD